MKKNKVLEIIADAVLEVVQILVEEAKKKLKQGGENYVTENYTNYSSSFVTGSYFSSSEKIKGGGFYVNQNNRGFGHGVSRNTCGNSQ